MEPIKKQSYEDYWKLTLEYTDINGSRFRGTLAIIVSFIDRNGGKFSEKLYGELQQEVSKKYPKKDMGSVRKSINQFVKLGFINYRLSSYHPDCVDFLEAPTNRKRRAIFSKILYTNSSFNRDVTKDSNKREINFLLKTLENNGSLKKKEIEALMTINIEAIKKGYLDHGELKNVTKHVKKINFIKRKYNQVAYLWNILRKLEDLHTRKDSLCFKEDAKEIFGDEMEENERMRDGYLHRLYKLQLKYESEDKTGSARCMVERLDYPSLVASHIKPFIKSNDTEAYDSNNGLLLSRNMDILFDQGYISFEDNGVIILSTGLSRELKNHLQTYSLDKGYINESRKKYLKYHRTKVLK